MQPVDITNSRHSTTSSIQLRQECRQPPQAYEHWLQTGPATQQQRLQIIGTTDRPLDILTADRLQAILYAPETLVS